MSSTLPCTAFVLAGGGSLDAVEVGRLHALTDSGLRRDYLVDPSGLRRLLEKHLPYALLERASIPMHVVAPAMVPGQEVLIPTGPTVEAMLASTVIPGVFPSAVINGRHLIDGGVANNTPISSAIKLGAKRIVALHVVPPPCPVDSSPYDYSACGTLIDRAQLTTRAWLAAGGMDKPCGVPHEMHEHGHP